MNKEELTVQVDKIYRALNTISISGYGNIKTFGNCLDALIELTKNINSYEDDVRNIIIKEFEKMESKRMEEITIGGVSPVNLNKPKPKRIKEGDEKDGKD